MGIIIKFAWNSIKEKKMRTFLIILAVSLASAMLFASLAIADTVELMHVNRLKKYYGTAEVMVYPNSTSPGPFFYTNGASVVEDKTQYAVGIIRRIATYKHNNEQLQVDLQGFELSDLQQMNPIQVLDQFELEPFSGKKIVIGAYDAKEYDLNLGDTLDVELGGRKHRFVIAGIASPEGLFRPDNSNRITTVVPRDTLASMVGGLGKVSQLYVKAKDEADVPQIIDELSKEYKRYTVRKTITRSEIHEQTKGIKTPFLMMLLVVAFISMFIIYTSFNVITAERLPVIGTFRSIGATKKVTDLLLLAESALYGIIGGLAGLGIGLGILKVMTNIMSVNPYSSVQVPAKMSFGLWHLLVSAGGAVLLAVVSSLIPIVRVSKKPVRDIVLNNIEIKAKTSHLRTVIGGVMLPLSVILPHFAGESTAMVITTICMIILPLSLVLLVPFCTNMLIRAFQAIYRVVFGNEGVLAAQNLRDNAAVTNSISLLTIGIASLLMISTLSNSVSIEVLNAYNDNRYDIVFSHSRANRNVQQRLRAVSGVTDTIGVYSVNNVSVPALDDNLGTVMGVEPYGFFDYHDYEIVGNRDKVLAEFDKGRNMILTVVQRDKYGLQEGDVLVVETNHGERRYTIVGFMHSLWNNGNLALVPDQYLKSDMDIRYMRTIYLRTNHDPSQVVQDIRHKFARENIWTQTNADLERMNMESNSQLFNMLTGFSVIAMIIGIFGILNNYLVSFISRKRSLAVLRSIGMSKKQNVKILFIEALTGGLIGSIVGIAGSLAFITLAIRLMGIIAFPLSAHYSVSMYLWALVSGVAISVIASIAPVLRSSKLSIIEGIKYE